MRTLKKFMLGALASVAMLFSASPASAIPIEIVFAIDASGSIGSTDFATQRSIYANVLNDATVLPQDGTIAVGIVRFATTATQIYPTTVIDGGSIAGLIAAINGMAYTGGGTDIGAAIDLATADIFGNAIASDRQVIDVSTDGVGSFGTSIADALTAGIDQINCLGIGAGANCGFIAGTGAFSITVAGFGDLEQALRTKIARETGRVPEPGTLALLGVTLAGLALVRRRMQG